MLYIKVCNVGDFCVCRIMNNEDIKQKPRIRILIIINIVLWCAYFALCAKDSNLFGLIILTMNLIVILTLTTIGQVIIHFCLCQKRIHPFVRILLFFIPSLALIIFTYLLPEPLGLPNQVQNQKSPSGNYILTVPIEKSIATSNYHGYRVWMVTIRNVNNKIEYKDKESNFLGHFNSYWVWDKDDRVWLYNSDNGNVYFWEKLNETWEKHHWGQNHTRQISRDLNPPEILYPGYARENQKGTNILEILQ